MNFAVDIVRLVAISVLHLADALRPETGREAAP